jgi:hypothetical protein
MLRQSTNFIMLDARQCRQSLDLLSGRVSSIKRRGEPCWLKERGSFKPVVCIKRKIFII